MLTLQVQSLFINSAILVRSLLLVEVLWYGHFIVIDLKLSSYPLILCIYEFNMGVNF